MAAELATTVEASMLGAIGPRRVDLRRLAELASAVGGAILAVLLTVAWRGAAVAEAALLAVLAVGVTAAFAVGLAVALVAPVLAATDGADLALGADALTFEAEAAVLDAADLVAVVGLVLAAALLGAFKAGLAAVLAVDLEGAADAVTGLVFAGAVLLATLLLAFALALVALAGAAGFFFKVADGTAGLLR